MLTHICNMTKWAYLLHGLLRRFTQKRNCPICRSTIANSIDWKFPYILYECGVCRILFRFPFESPEYLAQYYQTAYNQPGLTSDLPNPEQLAYLKDTKFFDSEKNAAHIVDILDQLGVHRGARILDYGANWGYTSYQLNRAGYLVEAYEISKTRAKFGLSLGLSIKTDLNELGRDFDVVLSSHVLEHLSNPAAALSWMANRCRTGGFILAFTPNGSTPRRLSDPVGFHKHWGQVHPVLITDAFLAWQFAHLPRYITATFLSGELRAWNFDGVKIGLLTGPELFFVVRVVRK